MTQILNARHKCSLLQDKRIILQNNLIQGQQTVLIPINIARNRELRTFKKSPLIKQIAKVSQLNRIRGCPLHGCQEF